MESQSSGTSPVEKSEEISEIGTQERGTYDRSSGRQHRVLRSLGLGLITGAADDDCSAIGTYAQAGAQFGYKILWTAPVTFPMMVAVVYLSGKLGQVTGEGLFSVLRSQYARWFVYLVLSGVGTGNTIEAGADVGGMAAAIGIIVHWPQWALVLCVTAATLVLQIWSSYRLIRNIFRVIAMSLLATSARRFWPIANLGEVLGGTVVPSMSFNRDSLSILVAIIGPSLSAYLYTWQSNEEVEEKEAAGKHSIRDRRGTTDQELRSSLWDIIFGMLFSNLVMYFIILATAATLFIAGKHNINTAAESAQSLSPLAGRAAGMLFTLGIIGVGFLAIPVMTTGAAYDVSQSFGWKNGLYQKPSRAKKFYGAVTLSQLGGKSCPKSKSVVTSGNHSPKRVSPSRWNFNLPPELESTIPKVGESFNFVAPFICGIPRSQVIRVTVKSVEHPAPDEALLHCEYR